LEDSGDAQSRMKSRARRPLPRRLISARGTALLLLSLACAACTCAPAAPRTRRQPLVTLPEGYRKKSLFISDDGQDYAFIATTAEGDRVVHGSEQGPLFPECVQPRMAPGTRKLFYWAIGAPSGTREVFLVADGQTIPTGFARPGTLFFSKNGSRWAAIGGTAPPEGSTGARGSVVIFADGRRMGSYPDASLPAFSPDEAHVAYLVEDESGRIKLFLDGEEKRTYDTPQVQSSPPVKSDPIGPNLPSQFRVGYLSNGSLLVLAQDRDGWALFRDQTRIGSYRDNVVSPWHGGVALAFGDALQSSAAIASGSATVAAAAPVAAWWERTAGTQRWRVTRNGTPERIDCARSWEAETPVLSADGRHVAYACATASSNQVEQTYVVADDRRYGPYANVWGIALSPDGEHVAYGADEGGSDTPWAYYLDGRARPLRFDRVWPPRFSADGKQVAWVAQKGERVFLFLNGDSYASSEDIIWAPRFNRNDVLTWAVIRGRRVSRVDVAVRGSALDALRSILGW